MPLIGLIIGGIDFSGLSVKVKDATISYGVFIQNVIDFLIVAVCIFFLVRFVNRLTRKNKEEAEEVAEVVEEKKDEQVVLLEEIRDLLKDNK